MNSPVVSRLILSRRFRCNVVAMSLPSSVVKASRARVSAGGIGDEGEDVGRVSVAGRWVGDGQKGMCVCVFTTVNWMGAMKNGSSKVNLAVTED